MNFKGVGASVAVLLAMCAPSAVGAETIAPAQPARPAVTARTFNYAGVPAGDLQKAQAQAESILRSAGIDVSWLDCPVAREAQSVASPRCGQPVGADLLLRIGSAKDSGQHYVSLGFSLVNAADGSAPYLATVYADLTSDVARRSGVDSRELLGCAIAHEIGHLLLGTNEHAATGLMRAAWSRAELQHHHTPDWQFLPGEAGTMRAAIARRDSSR